MTTPHLGGSCETGSGDTLNERPPPKPGSELDARSATHVVATGMKQRVARVEFLALGGGEELAVRSSIFLSTGRSHRLNHDWDSADPKPYLFLLVSSFDRLFLEVGLEDAKEKT